MARRSKGGILEELTTAPWWVSVVVACLVYVSMRWIIPSIDSPSIFFKSIAAAMPNVAWVFGLLFLLPAPISLFKSWERRKILDTQRDLSTIRSLHWSDFELMVGELFRRQGYVVEERGGSAPDGGVDLVLRKDGQKTIVQCKHWKAQQIGVIVVRELLGVMVAERANKGILVSSGRFTSEALEFARGKPIELMDGESLNTLVPAARKVLNSEPASKGIEPSGIEKPCPKCGSAMVKRVAKAGANVGQAFWGCSTFPKCRGTRPVQ